MDAGIITSKSKLNLKKALHEHFGFEAFKGDQEKIIKNILFSYSIFLFARQRKENGIKNKILPNLDMV